MTSCQGLWLSEFFSWPALAVDRHSIVADSVKPCLDRVGMPLGADTCWLTLLHMPPGHVVHEVHFGVAMMT